MKLNEYIYKKLKEIHVLSDPISALTAGDIETWIVEWYMGEFNEGGCGVKNTLRVPPSWLASWRNNGRIR
jgi:hypothetical protein